MAKKAKPSSVTITRARLTGVLRTALLALDALQRMPKLDEEIISAEDGGRAFELAELEGEAETISHWPHIAERELRALLKDVE